MTHITIDKVDKEETTFLQMYNNIIGLTYRLSTTPGCSTLSYWSRSSLHVGSNRLITIMIYGQ